MIVSAIRIMTGYPGDSNGLKGVVVLISMGRLTSLTVAAKNGLFITSRRLVKSSRARASYFMKNKAKAKYFRTPGPASAALFGFT